MRKKNRPGPQAVAFSEWMLSRKEIDVCGETWKLKFTRFRNRKQCGECDFSKETISIRRNMSLMMQMRTLAHEIEHALGGEEDAANRSEMQMVVLLNNMD